MSIRRPATVENHYAMLSLESIAAILSNRTGRAVSYKGVRISHARAMRKLRLGLEPIINELVEARDWPMPPRPHQQEKK